MLPPRIFAGFLILLPAFLIATPGAMAQPPGRGPRNISAGHIYLNSADPDAAIAFWKDMIGTGTFNFGSLNGVSTLGGTILFTRKMPAGPSAGSSIDHLALKIPDLQTFIDRLAKSPYKSIHTQSGEGRLMVDSPDGVRIELIEDNTMYAALEFSHVHLRSTQPKEMQAWYIKNLGGRPGMDDNPDTVLIPGMTLMFTQADSTVPSADRAIDHIAFEVKDLAAFCGKLGENGVKIDSAPHAVPEMKASVALLTDPWGTRIELIEKTAH